MSLLSLCRKVFTPYLFLLPALLLLAISAFYPLFQALYLSFTNYDFVGTTAFIGWNNYLAIFGDRLFWQVMGNTLIFLAIVVPCLVILSFGLALLVDQKIKGMAFFRSLYYLPVIVSVVIAAIAWKWIYAENGVLNFLISTIALSWQNPLKISWLTNPDTAILAIAAVTIWRGLGYYMAIYLAGLQSIPAELYEAAAIDGSDGWQKHWDITIPLMRPYILLVTVISTINGMKIFEEVYIMSRGGPANSTKTVVYYLYEKGFSSLEMGYASAIGVILFLAIFLISITTAFSSLRMANASPSQAKMN
jgi:putative chitobiose transport system permease protein